MGKSDRPEQAAAEIVVFGDRGMQNEWPGFFSLADKPRGEASI